MRTCKMSVYLTVKARDKGKLICQKANMRRAMQGKTEKGKEYKGVHYWTS